MSEQQQFEQWLAEYLDFDKEALERRRYVDEDGEVGYDGLTNEGMAEAADALASIALQAWQAARAQGGQGAEPALWLVENTFTGSETLYRAEAQAKAHRCLAVEIDRQDAAKVITPLYTHPPAKPEWVSEFAKRMDVELEKHDISGYEPVIKAVAEAVLATAPQADGWVKCSERLPTEADADCDGCLWVCWHDKGWRMEREYIRSIDCEYFAWMPTGLKRPQPPKQKGE